MKKRKNPRANKSDFLKFSIAGMLVYFIFQNLLKGYSTNYNSNIIVAGVRG